jgi:hypothetical protein
MNNAGVELFSEKDSYFKWQKPSFGIAPSGGPINVEIAGFLTSYILKHLIEDITGNEKKESSFYWDSFSFPRKNIF